MNIETIANDLTFTECPRWHNDRLWFSDFYTETVYSVDDNGICKPEVKVGDQPAGLGWMPNGHLRIVSQTQRKLLGYDGKTLYEVADLSTLANANCNDMVITQDGGAYIGHFGFDFHSKDFRPTAASLIYVNPNGEASTAAENMYFPNGSVILDNGLESTLIVAESMGHCLTAFTIEENGLLSNRRIWADLGRPDNHTIENVSISSMKPESITPDGIAADKDGGIWVATLKNELIKVIEGGAITERIEFCQHVIACAINHTDNSIYVCTTGHLTPDECIKYKSAKIERVSF